MPNIFHKAVKPLLESNHCQMSRRTSRNAGNPPLVSPKTAQASFKTFFLDKWPRNMCYRKQKSCEWTLCTPGLSFFNFKKIQKEESLNNLQEPGLFFKNKWQFSFLMTRNPPNFSFSYTQTHTKHKPSCKDICFHNKPRFTADKPPALSEPPSSFQYLLYEIATHSRVYLSCWHTRGHIENSDAGGICCCKHKTPYWISMPGGRDLLIRNKDGWTEEWIDGTLDLLLSRLKESEVYTLVTGVSSDDQPLLPLLSAQFWKEEKAFGSTVLSPTPRSSPFPPPLSRAGL